MLKGELERVRAPGPMTGPAGLGIVRLVCRAPGSNEVAGFLVRGFGGINGDCIFVFFR
jgi:hypothetical protein